MSSTELPIKYESVKEFRRRNISHSFAYKLAGEGEIRIVKLGSKALVDVAYSKPHFDDLLEAKIKLDKRNKSPEAPR
jgi:hypothetical protein